GSNCNLYEAAILTDHENLHIINNFVHMVPNTAGKIISHAVAKGESTSSFRGCIVINKESANTDAFLSNKCLLINEKARIHSVPILEILAKDVRCKHAASQGKIDQDQLFYMQSRGISSQNAERLITEGFITEVYKEVKNPYVKNFFEEIIGTKSGI
ncbi:MAG: SufD family Fe-S cluster assembly protein, partial [Planctomycetes bacterium]|nr:SufD family Fe-S cluster assembly protein [Planctomycetota bacterium]